MGIENLTNLKTASGKGEIDRNYPEAFILADTTNSIKSPGPYPIFKNT